MGYRSDNDDSYCCLALIKAFLYWMFACAILKITSVVVTGIYVYDVEVNDNYDTVAAKVPEGYELGTSTAYFAMATMMILFYSFVVAMFCGCCPVFDKNSWFGLVGSMIFWVSFFSDACDLTLMKPIHTELRCGGNFTETGCYYEELENEHLIAIGFYLIVPMIVGLCLMLFASYRATQRGDDYCGCVTSHLLWYLFFPVAIGLLIVSMCAGPPCGDNNNLSWAGSSADSSTGSSGGSSGGSSIPQAVPPSNYGIDTSSVRNYKEML